MVGLKFHYKIRSIALKLRVILKKNYNYDNLFLHFELTRQFVLAQSPVFIRNFSQGGCSFRTLALPRSIFPHA